MCDGWETAADPSAVNTQYDAEWNQVDHLMSNDVLEAELELLIKQKAALLGRADDELDSRIMAVQIAMQVLVAQVSTGALTMEAYLANIKAAAVEMKAAALELKEAGDKQNAVMLLRRIKLIQAEIAGAEE